MPHDLEERYMRLAIAKAEEGMKRGQTPFGACIARNGAVVACEHNVVWDTMDITAHAEVHAIRQACQELGTIDLSGCVMYSTCEPCPMCFSACHWARIDLIVFGARIEHAEEGGFSELLISNEWMKEHGASPIDLVPGFLLEENLRLFAQWKALEGRRVY